MRFLWLKCLACCMAMCNTKHELFLLKGAYNYCIHNELSRGKMSPVLYDYLYRKIYTIYAYYSQFVK